MVWGLKKKEQQKKGQRVTSRKKQSLQGNPIAGSTSVKFINKPLSNFDLLNWVKQLGIKHFRGVYSRDALPTKILTNEVGIINLDSEIGSGTHWVAYRNGKNVAEYFDSFGLIMPSEIQKYLSTSGKQIFHSGDEIQERDSVLCGYWCLYYLMERQKGVPMLNVIHNANFDMNDQSVNHRFIIDYFKNKQGGENPLGKAFEAAKIAEQITRKIIPSTNHVFDRYWSGDILKNAFTGTTGITSKKFWTKPKKGTVMRLVKNPKTGKYENVYIEP